MLKFNIQNIQNLQFKLFIILCGIVLMILAACLKPACSTNYNNHAKRSWCSMKNMIMCVLCIDILA